MSVIDVIKDPEAGVLTAVAEYPATAEDVWRLWADPRRLERWWGPPSHPATVTHHDLTAGGVVRYFMTGPCGERHHGGWQVVGAEPPHRLEFQDFFADEDGAENPDPPRTETVVTIGGVGAGVTRMTITSRYPSREAMAEVLAMGMEEGVRQALGQTDALLAGPPA